MCVCAGAGGVGGWRVWGSGQSEKIDCRASLISTSPMWVIDVQVSPWPLTVRDGR